MTKGRQLGLATALSKVCPCIGNKRVESTWAGNILLQIGFCVASKRVATFFPKFNRRVAWQGSFHLARVSQLGMAAPFSKFYPRIAHKRVRQLGLAPSLSKFYSCIANKKVRSTWNGKILLEILPLRCPQRGEATLNGNIIVLRVAHKRMATSF